MQNAIVFRPPLASDIDALFVYAKKIEAEDTFITLNPQEPVTLEEEQNYLTSLLKKIEKKEHITLFAFDGSTLIGTASVDKGGKRKRHVGRFGIALLKEYRGRGIGRKLLEDTIEKAKQDLSISIVFLEHFANNPKARKLYESVGFKEIGIFPKAVFYKGEYVDEPIMVKEV